MTFTSTTYDNFVAEDASARERLFLTYLGPRDDFDYIIIGSGMGGGILADDLADRVGKQKRILVLEAGSFLYPTHVYNVCRFPNASVARHFACDTFWQWNNTNPNAEYYIHEKPQLNVGGRSIFWSGLIPTIQPWELDFFPTGVRNELAGKYLKLGGERMNESSTMGETAQKVVEKLQQTSLAADFEIQETPRALHQPYLADDQQAKRELNLSDVTSKGVEANEHRLVPKDIEQFFIEAAPDSGIQLNESAEGSHCYCVGNVSRNLIAIGDQQEDRYGRLGRSSAKVVFSKEYLADEPTLEWVTLGHPLFESVRTDVLARADDHLLRGVIFHDLHRSEPALLDIFAASIKDGRGDLLNRRLFVIETSLSGEMTPRDLAYLRDIIPAPARTMGPAETMSIPTRRRVEQLLYQQILRDWGNSAANERRDEVERIARYVEVGLNSLIEGQQTKLVKLMKRRLAGNGVPGLDRQIAQAERCLNRLKNRLDMRKHELELQYHCGTTDIAHLGRAWVAPHPERATS